MRARPVARDDASFAEVVMIVRRLLLAFAFLLLALPALAAPDRVVIGQTFIAPSLDPADGSAGWALVSHGVAEKLFTVDRAGRIVGELADDIARQPDGAWLVTLRAGRRFADGTPVTGAAVAAALGRTNERNAAARASVGRMSFVPVDALRLLVRGERATPVMAAVLAEWAFVVYRPGDAPVFTGAYMVERLRPGDALELLPNPHFPGAAARGPVTIRRFVDGQTMAIAFAAGELDMAFALPVETLRRVRARPSLAVTSFPVGYQYMLWLNTRREALADPRVRRAIDLGIDRNELALAINGGAPAAGAFARGTPFALPAPQQADSAAANRLLDEAGWLRGTDGRRRKDGRPLELSLVAYPQRPDLVTFQPVIRARLAALGIGIQTQLAEQASVPATSGAFDLLLWAQHTAPAGDPGWFLNAFFRTGAGNNVSGFASPAVDRLLDELATVGDMGERAALATEIQRRVQESAPVAFLLTPEWHVGLGPRLAGYEPWGSDYAIVRPDLSVR